MCRASFPVTYRVMKTVTPPFRHVLLSLAVMAWPTQAADLGPREWPLPERHECVVVPAVTTPEAHEFLEVFAREWCQQGWSATSQLVLRESVAERWVTHVDILRNEESVLSVPMTPYVEKNMGRIAAAAVARISALLVQAEAGMATDTRLGPAGNQPGGERK